MTELLVVATGGLLARVADRGGSWHVQRLLELPGLQCVAVDPRDPAHVVVGLRGDGVWETFDGGSTWGDAKLPAGEVFSVAVSAADGAVYAGCEPSAVYVRRDGEPWRELSALRQLPSAPTWSFPPRPWTSHVRWIAPSPHEPALVLVGIELGGLMRTTDGGETWDDHRPGAQRDVHAIAWHPEVAGRAYEAAGGGAAFSIDGGDTWTPADEGRDRHYTWALAVDPVDPATWYVSAAPGPYEAHGTRPASAALYRSRGGEPWQELDLGLERPLETMPYALAAKNGLLIAGLRDGRLFASEDGGDAWHQLNLDDSDLPAVVAVA